MHRNGRQEYDRMTLDMEYRRDREKGLDTALPVNYYPDDDPTKKPMMLWRSHANIIYTNWLNYYVYQNTPYDIGGIMLANAEQERSGEKGRRHVGKKNVRKRG